MAYFRFRINVDPVPVTLPGHSRLLRNRENHIITYLTLNLFMHDNRLIFGVNCPLWETFSPVARATGSLLVSLLMEIIQLYLFFIQCFSRALPAEVPFQGMFKVISFDENAHDSLLNESFTVVGINPPRGG